MQIDYEIDPKQARRFKSLAELAAATGQEVHGLEVDYDIFETLRPPTRPDSSRPGTAVSRWRFELPAVKPDSKAVDAGGAAAECQRRVRRRGARSRRVLSGSAAARLRAAVAEGTGVLPVAAFLVRFVRAFARVAPDKSYAS